MLCTFMKASHGITGWLRVELRDKLIPVLHVQTMNLKRPVKLSARCCHNGAKIFLAPFIRASNSILVGKNFICRSLFGCSLFLIWSTCSHRRMLTLVLRWLFSRLEILFSLIVILSNWQSEHLAKKSHYMVRYTYIIQWVHVTAAYAYRMSTQVHDMILLFIPPNWAVGIWILELFKWARTVAFPLFSAFVFSINRFLAFHSFSNYIG